MTKKDHEQKTRLVTYYGKKAFKVHHPLILLLKPAEPKLPDYSNENIDDDGKS